jgi:hypothetical protein
MWHLKSPAYLCQAVARDPIASCKLLHRSVPNLGKSSSRVTVLRSNMQSTFPIQKRTEVPVPRLHGGYSFVPASQCAPLNEISCDFTLPLRVVPAAFQRNPTQSTVLSLTSVYS